MDYLILLCSQQNDYVNFIHALIYFLAAFITFFFYKQKTPIPWNWYGLFLTIHGIYHAHELLAQTLYFPFRTELLAVVSNWPGLIAMAFFARPALGSRVLATPVIAMLATLFVGWESPEKRYLVISAFFMAPSMLLGAVALWKYSKNCRFGSLIPLAAVNLFYGITNIVLATLSLCALLSADTAIHLIKLVCIGAGAVIFIFFWIRFARYNVISPGRPAAAQHPIVFPLLTFVLVLFGGGFFVNTIGQHRSEALSKHLLERAHVGSRSLDITLIRHLNGTEKDIGTPAYEALKQHLMQIRLYSRFLYLTTLREGQVIFLVDSEPSDSPDVSPAGQIYTEADPAFYDALAHGKSTVIGPYHDRWGSWVTALVPIPVTLSDGSPVCYGADMPAKVWLNEIARDRLFGMSIVFLFIMFFFYFYLNAYRIRRMNDRLADELDLFEGGPVFVMQWKRNDRALHTVYASPNTQFHLGHPGDSLISGSVSFDSLIHEEEQKPFQTLLQTLSETANRSGEIELRLNCSDTYRWFHLFIRTRSAAPMAHFHAYLTDIDNGKKSEIASRLTTERLLLHFKCAPYAIIEWDTQFRVVEWNPSAEAVFGFSKNEALGKQPQELIIPKHVLPIATQVMGALMEGKESDRSIYENLTKEGKLITCLWHNFSLIDEKGALIGIASVAEDITEKRRLEERVEFLAYYDELTGLPNRQLFRDRLLQECRRHDRTRAQLAVILLDIDFFKTVNDSLGHDIGNKLLEAIAQRFREIFRKSDTISRIGGDEFAILLPDFTNTAHLETVMKELFSRFEAPFIIGKYELFVTLSVGCTIYKEDSSEPEKLLPLADIAMYAAKEAGRNTYRRFQAGMSDAVVHRLEIHNGLVNAFRHHELLLHYQPQYDPATHTITGAEALLRWMHPEKGFIPPGDFIAVAEETGLIVPIGQWIIRTACEQLKRLQEMGHKDFVIAINLSSRQFKEKKLFENIASIIQETGVPPRSVELELTESILIQNAGEVLFVLSQFKQMGVRLSLDDFGTGYSSLSYLKLYPIDKVKIDQSFVKNALSNESDRSLIQAIIAMSHALGLSTIAEGVETKEQLDLITQYGCNEIQGYYIARPIPAEELETFLKNFNPPTS